MHRLLGIAVLLGLVLLVGCAQQSTDEQAPAEPAAPAAAPAEPAGAHAEIQAKSGSQLGGTATFSAAEAGVTLVVEIQNAPPGPHAVHLHDVGDCSAADGTSAGGHWNPTAENHGQWNHKPFHLGDVGNITIDEQGHGSLTLTTDLWSIGSGAENDVVGHAIVVHAGADDFTSQPTGAAGGRIGCGVIE